MAVLNALALLFMLLAGAASAAGVAQAPGAAQQSPYGEKAVGCGLAAAAAALCLQQCVSEPPIVLVLSFALVCCANGLIRQLACVCVPRRVVTVCWQH